MTIQEIFVLNNAIDGKEICFMPELSGLNMPQPLFDTVKDLLIKQGILRNHNEFTEEGMNFAEMLLSYKEAKKFIKILSLSIGIISNEKAIIINQVGENNYYLSLIDIKEIADQFLEVFDFLGNAKNSETLSEIKIRPRKMEKEYANNEGSFRFETKNNIMSSDDMCFLQQKQLYIYDYKKHVLSPMSYRDAISLIRERLTIL